MKNNLGVIIFIISVLLSSYTLHDNRYRIREAKKCYIIRDGKQIQPDDIHYLYSSDTIVFLRYSYLTIEGPSKNIYKWNNNPYGKYAVASLLDMEEKKWSAGYGVTDIYILPSKSESKPAMAEKSANTDSLRQTYQSVENRIYNYISNPQNDKSDYPVEFSLNFVDSICTLINHSNDNLFADVLYLGNEKCYSIFLSSEDWKSDVVVLAKEEIQLFLPNLYKKKGKYLLVCSKEPFPLNSMLSSPLDYLNIKDSLSLPYVDLGLYILEK